MSQDAPHLPEWTHLREWQREAIFVPYLAIEIVPTPDGNAHWFAEQLYSACAASGARVRVGVPERQDVPQPGLQVVLPLSPSAGSFSVISALRDAGLNPGVYIDSAVTLTTIRVGARPKCALPMTRAEAVAPSVKPIAICAIFRNEAPYLLEWIAYHSKLGFDHFVLYDNKSDDSGAALVRNSGYGEKITIIDWPNEPGQLAAYQHYIDHFRDRFEWTAFIDIDEFIHVLDGLSLRTTLRDYEGFSGVLLQWLLFGPSGHDQRPEGAVIESYIWRTLEDEPGNHHVKTLAKNAALVRPGATPHTFELDGAVCNARRRECANLPILDAACHERIVINHYFTKSKQEWIDKIRKGKATTTREDDQYDRAMFEHMVLKSTVRDERLKEAVSRSRIGRPLWGPTDGPFEAPAALANPPRGMPRPSAPTESKVPVRRPLVLDNVPGGHYGNLMMKYMTGLKLQQRIPGMILSNFVMPYWRVDHPSVPAREGDRILAAEAEQHLDMNRIEYLANAGLTTRVEWTGYGQRMENFPDRDLCRKIFSTPETASLGDKFADTDLVCPIRGGEILDGRHGGYTLLPVTFYRDVAERLGLRPVFFGQLERNPYFDALHQELPDAIYRPGSDPLSDFQTVRKARNIVVCISTFVWLAAWLSDAKHIVLPVYGLYNPLQFPNHDLLPLADERYTYFEFPVHWAVPIEHAVEAHQQILGAWHPIRPENLARL
jgi:hypothetical protein